MQRDADEASLFFFLTCVLEIERRNHVAVTGLVLEGDHVETYG